MFSTETVEAKNQWKDIFKILKVIMSTRLLYVAKLSLHKIGDIGHPKIKAKVFLVNKTKDRR